MSNPGWFIDANLALAAAIFAIGLLGVLWKRNAIAVFMCVELMLNAANLAFATFARATGLIDGGILLLFVMTVAAAEAGVGLAIFIGLFRTRRSIEVDEITALNG
jgi:NADH-quinone oxidoreductase subunit K